MVRACAMARGIAGSPRIRQGAARCTERLLTAVARDHQPGKSAQAVGTTHEVVAPVVQCKGLARAPLGFVRAARPRQQVGATYERLSSKLDRRPPVLHGGCLLDPSR